MTPKRFEGLVSLITIDEETTKAEPLKENINEKITAQQNVIWRIKIQLDSVKRGSHGGSYHQNVNWKNMKFHRVWAKRTTKSHLPAAPGI